MALPQLDIDRLTAEERMELAERLWDSLKCWVTTSG
jgi:putative addiction module component (TIGR02574 family)